MSGEILIVEDEGIVARDLKRELESLGHVVCGIATTGRDALQIAESASPDLVLMDINIKGNLDGVHVAKEMRNRLNLPVLYLTAYADEWTLERVKETQPVGYIVKPFTTKELRAAVEIALHQKSPTSVKDRERWFSRVLQSMGDAVIASDLDGTIRFMNLSAEIITGWQLNEAYGKNLFTVLTFGDDDPPVEAHYGSSDSPRAENILGWVRTATVLPRDGMEVPVEYMATPIRDHDGSRIGTVLVLRDITRRLD